jgi:hypothetical protein
VWTDGDLFGGCFSEYLDLFAPLFAPRRHNVQDVFEFVCCLVHPSGIQSSDEDPLFETTAFIEDLVAFARQSHMVNGVDHPARARARLGLLSYCHLTEGDFFYTLLVNLLRVRCAESWTHAPFADLSRPLGAKKGAQKKIPASANKKITRIQDYAQRADMAGVSTALSNVYLSAIRNAVFHADYTLTDTRFIWRVIIGCPPKGI